MAPGIRVFKKDLFPFPEVGKQLSQLSKRVKEEENACIYIPQDAKEQEMTDLLKTYQIPFDFLSEREFLLEGFMQTRERIEERYNETKRLVSMSHQVVVKAKEIVSQAKEIAAEIIDHRRKDQQNQP